MHFYFEFDFSWITTTAIASNAVPWAEVHKVNNNLNILTGAEYPEKHCLNGF